MAWAEVPALGDVNIMGFVPWARDGWPDCLEGFQNGSDVDLGTWDLAALEPLRAWGGVENEAAAAVRH